MSLQIFVSHVGKRLSVDVGSVTSPDSLRTWIADNTKIPVSRQILMTVRGKNVKQQHLVAQGEIFLYDKKYVSAEAEAIPTEKTSHETPSLRIAPSTLENENSVKAWQELFRARRTWALEAADAVKTRVSYVEEQVGECDILERSANVALENLRNHIGTMKQSFEKTEAWAKDLLQDQAEVLKEWPQRAQTLQELPIREDMGRLLSNNLRRSNINHGNSAGTMYSLLDGDALLQAATALEASSDTFRKSIEELRSKIGEVNNDSDQAAQIVNFPWPQLDTNGMVQEAETIAKKISSDYEEVLRVSGDSKSIPRISRLAAYHTSNLLPGFTELVTECSQMQKDAESHREALSEAFVKALRQVSVIQSGLGGLQHSISSLSPSESGEEAFDTIERVFRLPQAYGSILVEAIRRSEWSEKMRTEMQSVKDDVFQRKDDEIRRRRKWASSMEGLLSEDLQTTEALIDLTFSAPANPWPFVTRDEIFGYVDDLRALGIDDAVVQINQNLRELESPNQARKPRTKAFKNGSVHDLNQSSMVQNTNEVRVLQDEKTRLEDKLRGSESRIRKLEDLLHRQSQLNRPPSGAFTPVAEMERQPSSPGPGASRTVEISSRRSSVSLRRLSNQTPDEKAMVQRIVTLEAQITKLQQEAHAERRSSNQTRDKMEEAESVKRDLMANFESQRQEFDDERQRLEDDNHEMKVRIEEMEEELDRVLGSRDHERMNQEQTIQSLRGELDKLRKTSGDELDQIRQNKVNLQRDLSACKERLSQVERSLKEQRDEKSTLQSQNMSMASQLRLVEEQQQSFVGVLQSVHSNLSPAGAAPDEMKRLVNALEVLSEGTAIHVRGLDEELQLATAENKSNEEKIQSLTTHIEKTQSDLQKTKSKIIEAEERLEQERNALSAVRAELADEKGELQNLREKFAAGETGSGALKARLEAEEKRVAELLESQGESDAKVHNLQQELARLADKVQETEIREESLKTLLHSRKTKAKDLSERLFHHNDRMVRMLETFGYSVSRQDEGLLIQRASKANASTILPSEIGTPMKRTVSGSTPIQHYSDPSDLETLYWISDDDPEAEEFKYQAFMNALARLDLDATTELVTKRYKDVETLAKKYQKDSRAHRDKTHRLQSEAHDKIAYRTFKEGDLALFLPTRNQATRPWAAFNVGAPHYFLREQDAHKLQSRDWLLARISKIEERVVDLSRSFSGSTRDRASTNADDGHSAKSVDDENPFELSDGLRWYMIDAAEEKPGAPSTPGLAKSTVAASVIEVKGHMGRKSTGGKDAGPSSPASNNAAKTLHKSLDSRRSSEASRKSGGLGALRASGSTGGVNPPAPSPLAPVTSAGNDGVAEGRIGSATPINATANTTVKPSDADLKAREQGQQAREDAQVFEVASGSDIRLQRPDLAVRTLSGDISRISSPTKTNRASPAKSLAHVPSPSKPSKQRWESLFNWEFSS